MKGTMKAAVFRGIEHIVVEDMPIPECPQDGVLIKVYFCGICGGDIRNYSNGLRDGVKEQIMGHEISGEIVETGANVTEWKVGDRVALAPDVSCGKCWYCKRAVSYTHLLLQVGLDVSPYTKVESLSMGERQLIEIAKSILGNPKVIIFDEPTTSDVYKRQDVGCMVINTAKSSVRL